MKTHFTILIILGGLLTNLHGQTYERYKHLCDTSITSTNLRYEKQLSITVPLEYQEDIDFQFPVIIVFDLHLQRMQRYVLQTIDYLTSTLSMPPAVIIGVESGSGIKRRHETNFAISDSGALGEENEKFIFEELIPLAENQWNVSQFRLLIGHSRYGYYTTYLLTERMSELNAVVSMSPFYTQKNVNLVDTLVSKLKDFNLPHHVYYRFAIGNDYPNDYAAIDKEISTGSLQHEKFNIEGKLFSQAFHNATPGLGAANALYDIFEYWAKNQNAYFTYGEDNISMLPKLQENIVDHYGEFLPFSMAALNGKGWEFFGENKFKNAIEIWTLLLNQYPNLSEFYLYIASAQKELNLLYHPTLKIFSEELKKSQVYSDEEKIELLREMKKLIKN